MKFKVEIDCDKLDADKSIGAQVGALLEDLLTSLWNDILDIDYSETIKVDQIKVGKAWFTDETNIPDQPDKQKASE